MMGPEYLGRLLDVHGGPLVLAARSWCACAEDVVQEAFVKLAAQGPAPVDPVAWLYRVVRNGAIAAGRGERRRLNHESKAAVLDRFEEAPGARLDATAAAEALAGLPAEEREIIVMHLWGGRSFAEIAELTASSAATAHRRYAAGLARLREKLAC